MILKSQLLSLISILFSCATIYAQDFIGYVKKADSTSSPVFQAKVEITEGNKPFKIFKTYFDGSFKFTPNKSQTYLLKISYSGYADTAYTFTTDKNAKADVQSVTVKLKKDGMRLMGMVKSREEDFPIKGATVVVRNVMTRKEDRITTEIDGKYNFKLEYETNYKVWIDKRSTGIFNVYKDTSFYISTIGFNQPLDYKLDIFLDWMEENTTTPVREGYDASKQPANKNLKPVINIASSDSKNEAVKKDTVPLIVNNPEEEKQLLKEEEKKAATTKKPKKISSIEVSDTSVIVHKQKVKSKKKKEEIEVVIFRDTDQVAPKKPTEPKADESVDLLEMTRQKALADKKAREAKEAEAAKVANEKKEAEKIATQKHQQELIAAAEILAKQMKFSQDSITRQKTKEDSIMRAKQRNDSIMLIATQKQKMKDDSIFKAKAQMEKIAKDLAAKEKAKQDSIAKFKLQQEQALVKAKQHADSVSLTTTSSLKKTAHDSSVQKKTFYLTKTQEELIAAAEIFAKRKKIIQDSIAKEKELEIKKAGAQEQKKN